MWTLILFALPLGNLWAQKEKHKLVLGPTKIGLDQEFTLTIESIGQPLNAEPAFPELRGFEKGETRSSSVTNLVDGKNVTIYSITQAYVADELGRYAQPKFSISISGAKPLIQAVFTVEVLPEGALDELPMTGPVASVPAQLVWFTKKKKVFQGEGLYVALQLLVPEAAETDLQFFQLNEQLEQLTIKAKNSHCLELNYDQNEVAEAPTTLNGQAYTAYTILAKTIYAQEPKSISLPALDLVMEEQKAGQWVRTNFRAKAMSIPVMTLPKHPLSSFVPVGQFKLSERLEKTKIKTGAPFRYSVELRGLGQWASVVPPMADSLGRIDIFTPDVEDDLQQTTNGIDGYRRFRYSLVALKPGPLDLGQVFSFIYFDPERQRYDTLRSNRKIFVEGQVQQGNATKEVDPWKDLIATADNKPYNLKEVHQYREWANIALAVLAVLGLFAILWNRS